MKRGVAFLRRHRVIPAMALAIAFTSGSTNACSLGAQAYDLEAALASPHPTLVVFRGRIESAEDATTSEPGARARNYHIRADRWWHGAARERVVARGAVNTMAGTSCEGTFDFSASPGQAWLIVGHEENGVIHPSRQLSKPLADGVLPLKVRILLDAKMRQKVRGESRWQ